MGRNITPEYIQFVEAGSDITDTVQDVIDKSQYVEGFLPELQALLKKYESPFHLINNGAGTIRSLKQQQHVESTVSNNSPHR